MEQFPLNWRWTDSRWNELPASALAQVRPLRESKAAELLNYSLTLHHRSGLNEELFANISQLDDRNTENSDTVRTWLKHKIEEKEELVFVSWDARTALVTSGEVFCEYWDDFCYPFEDVMVWPASGQWALFYHHEELLYFGCRR